MSYTAEERAVLKAARRIKAKTRNKAKRARPISPKADRGRVRDPGFLAFLRRQPCCICAYGPPNDAAHIRSHLPGEMPTGLQRKPSDRRATPLCRSHHLAQHDMNEMAFWRLYCLDPFAIADRLYAQYQALGD